MLHLFSGLDLWVGLSLVLALTFVLAFEFINGFHDTANAIATSVATKVLAVATVIYTKAMPPHLAVILSGIFNFLGVLLGGVGVAYAIVHLLPVELLINVDTGRGLAMVFAMLSAAIAWNLGTWYFGIPASSSHTLIGSILGVGMANALLTDISLAEGVNWGKASWWPAASCCCSSAGCRCRKCTRRPSSAAPSTPRSTRPSGTAWCWSCRPWASASCTAPTTARKASG